MYTISEYLHNVNFDLRQMERRAKAWHAYYLLRWYAGSTDLLYEPDEMQLCIDLIKEDAEVVVCALFDCLDRIPPEHVKVLASVLVGHPVATRLFDIGYMIEFGVEPPYLESDLPF